MTPEEEISNQTYKIVAADFAAQKNTPDFWAEEFKQFESYLPKGKVLDVGCGWGRDFQLFDSGNYDYTGVDIVENMIEQARRLFPQGNFQVMDFYDLQFLPKTFDGFWSPVSIMLVPTKQLSTALESLKKVLKPGAVGFVSCKKGEGEGFEVLPSGLQRFFAYYDLPNMKEALQHSGFNVLSGYEKVSPVDSKKVYICCFVKYA